jgi:hypothetical protein
MNLFLLPVIESVGHVTWFRHVVGGISLIRSGVDLRPDHVGVSIEKSVIGVGFALSFSVFPCQGHSTIAPYSFIHLRNFLSAAQTSHFKL